MRPYEPSQEAITPSVTSHYACNAPLNQNKYLIILLSQVSCAETNGACN